MKKLYFIGLGLLFICCGTFAQQSFNITDQQPALVDGLALGYQIKSTEVKTVGDKGDFSRYAIRFYVTNTTNQGKIILYKQGWNIMGNVSDQLAQFICLNATGARFTTKEAIINAIACNVLAMVDDKDCATNKNVKNQRFVQIGYWIKPGQTISTDGIVIVPLNQLPNMQVNYLAAQLQPIASAGLYGGNDVPPPPPIQRNNQQSFTKIRNILNNTYLNEETGLPRTSVIDSEWWSAQWQLLQIPGTNNYWIKNKWKGDYLGSADGFIGLTPNPQVPTTNWIMMATPDPSIFRFKNAATGGFLSLEYNKLAISPPSNNMTGVDWQLEKP